MRAWPVYLGLALCIFLLLVVHTGHPSQGTSGFVVIHRGQPMPTHYIEAWQFGNVTIVEVAPGNTVVTVAPWS
jgi:hypothetical protein